jgi:hypothetical protein
VASVAPVISSPRHQRINSRADAEADTNLPGAEGLHRAKLVGFLRA